jgi:hypothetical protein
MAPAANDTGLDDTEIDVALGERYYMDDEKIERQFADEIGDIIRQFIVRRFKEGRRPALRDAHAGDNGCVKAIFRVDQNIAKDLRHGVFAKAGAEFNAWIRFSNGNSEVLNPRLPDARGMAVKLMGVDGPKLLDDERETQDFVMANNPTFFVDDLLRYRNSLVKFHSGGYLRQFSALPELNWREKVRAFRVNGTWIINPLNCQYWSMTPYRLGSDAERIAIKFSAKPSIERGSDFRSRIKTFLDPHFSLKENMQSVLSSREMWFDFFVQRYVDHRTPIEDTLTEWDESISPPIHVAKITIPVQDLSSVARGQLCQNLSFNPWHCLPEHRPLGAENRVRKMVYRNMSKCRRELNGISTQEPSPDEGQASVGTAPP